MLLSAGFFLLFLMGFFKDLLNFLECCSWFLEFLCFFPLGILGFWRISFLQADFGWVSCFFFGFLTKNMFVVRMEQHASACFCFLKCTLTNVTRIRMPQEHAYCLTFFPGVP